MKVICPTCSEQITLDDDMAGKATFCPQCKAAFTAPTLFPTPPPVPPVSVPPPSISATTGPSDAAAREASSIGAPSAPLPPTPSSVGARAVAVSLMPEFVQWIAPAALVLSVVLTFFSWNGVYPGGHAVYTQSPWGALFGNFSSDVVGEGVLRLNTAEEGSQDKPLKDYVGWNFLMLPYLPGLLATTILTILLTILPTLRMKLPPQVEKYMPWRMGAVAALALLLTAVLCLQSLRGFSLENGVLDKIDARLKTDREKAKTPEEIKVFEIRRGQIIEFYEVEQTTAHSLALVLHFAAVIGAAGTLLLQRRGDKPPPRIEVSW